jgi:hypothetical protein
MIKIKVDEIFTTGIHGVFRGLKFESDAETGKSPFPDEH